MVGQGFGFVEVVYERSIMSEIVAYHEAGHALMAATSPRERSCTSSSLTSAANTASSDDNCSVARKFATES